MGTLGMMRAGRLKTAAGRGALAIIAGIALAACGSASKSSTSTHASSTTAVSSTNAAQTQAKLQKLTNCAKADTDYLKLASDITGMGNLSSASTQQIGQAVADASNYKTDLTVLRASATAVQQAQVDQYQGVIGQLQSGLQSAAAGAYGQAISAWTGVAPQIGLIPNLVNAICTV